MKEFNFDGYKLIAKSRESDLVEYLGRNIPKYYGESNCVVTKDYIFAKGKIPVLLCAHMDTVFKSPPKTILYDPKEELIWSPEGIGGDDRNGIYSILYLIEKFKDNLPSVLFTTQEEHGCVGAERASRPLKSKVGDINFAIQIDRQGENDAVFYKCNNRNFIDYICKFGYKETPGSRTDICVICPEWDIAGVNFSCGYINNHTEKEIVNVKHMFSTIHMIEKILLDEGNKQYFPYYQQNKKKVNRFQKKDDEPKEELQKENFNDVFGEKPKNDDDLLLAIFGEKKI